jgi:hypothetical protein
VPGSGLHEVFGFEEREVVREEEIEVAMPEMRWPGYWHRAILTDLAPDVEILAEFPGEQGGPAVVTRRYGEGAVLYIGSQADVAAGRAASSLLPDTVAECFRTYGVEPALRIEPGDVDLELRGHYLEGEGAGVVIVVNYQDSSGGYRVRLRTARPVTSVDDLLTGQPVQVQQESGGVRWGDRWPAETEARAFAIRFA